MTKNLKTIKKTLRLEALARRDALDPFWRIEASMEMAETARDGVAIEPGQIVSGFWPIRSEVDVRPLMFALREKGARLCLPAILDKTTIAFRELVRGAPMVDMGFGTRVPATMPRFWIPTSCWFRSRPSTDAATASAMVRATTTAPSRAFSRTEPRRA